VRIAGAFEAAVFRPLRCAVTTVGRPGPKTFGGQTVGVGKFARIVAIGPITFQPKANQ
jgi:hypothetical protein